VTASDPESLATSRRQTAFIDLAIAVQLGVSPVPKLEDVPFRDGMKVRTIGLPKGDTTPLHFTQVELVSSVNQ
jgi:hypothetical protein